MRIANETGLAQKGKGLLLRRRTRETNLERSWKGHFLYGAKDLVCNIGGKASFEKNERDWFRTKTERPVLEKE